MAAAAALGHQKPILPNLLRSFELVHNLFQISLQHYEDDIKILKSFNLLNIPVGHASICGKG